MGVIISVCIALVLYEIIKIIVGKKPNKRIAKSLKRVSEYNIKGYFPVIIGVFIGFTIMSRHIAWAPAAAFVGGVLGFFAIKLFKKVSDKLNEDKKAGEVLLLYEIISKYADSGYSLYAALSTGIYFTDIIKEPLQKCINMWNQGPKKAIEGFKKETNTSESDALARIIERALDVGPEKMAELLSSESDTMERLRNMRVEQGFGTRLIVQTVYLALPGLALIGVTLVPVGYYIQKAITSIRIS